MANDSGIGAMIRAFDTPKYERQNYNDSLQSQIEALTGELGTGRTEYDAALGNYRNAIEANNPRIAESLDKWSKLADVIRNRPGSPLDEYKNLLDYTTGKIQGSVINPLISHLQNKLRQQQLARGINTGLDSTMGRLQNAGIANNAYLQAYQSALGNAGVDSSRLAQQRMGEDTFKLGLTPQYLALLTGQEHRALLPAQARLAALNQLTGSGMGLSALDKSNLRGYQLKKSTLGQIADFSDAFHNTVDDAYDKALQLYGTYSGGGMGGGGGQQRQKHNYQIPEFQGYQQREPDWDSGYARLYQSAPVDYNPSLGNEAVGGYA